MINSRWSDKLMLLTIIEKETHTQQQKRTFSLIREVSAVINGVADVGERDAELVVTAELWAVAWWPGGGGWGGAVVCGSRGER